MRAHLRTAVAVLLGVVLLALFLRNASLHDVWVEVTRARTDLVLLSVGITALTYVLRAVRWQYLLSPIGRVGFGNALRMTVIGFAASAVLPARAGEVLRPWLLARKEGLSATAAFATIILERVLDTVMVLLLFGVFLLFADSDFARGDPLAFSRLKIGGAVTALVSVVALAVMFFLAGHPRTLDSFKAGFERLLPARFAAAGTRFLRTFADGLAIVRQPWRLALALLLSLPLWLSIASGIWCVSRAFHIDLPFIGSFMVMALLVVGVAVPTPAGVGGFHYFYRLAATAFYAAPNDRAVGAAIVLHAVSFVPVAIVGLALLTREGVSLAGAGSLTRADGAGAGETA
jgi:glycosyltransferase 2 family protein